jgi:enamine deaminase RidA (YjgF/YER057c/UK114 family)
VKALAVGSFPAHFTFSPGISAAGLVITSGHTAAERQGMERQAHGVYDKLDAVLAAEGMSLLDVTHVTEYVALTAMDEYHIAARVRQERVGDTMTTTVCVERLVRSAALIEVEVIVGARDLVYLSTPECDEGIEVLHTTAYALEGLSTCKADTVVVMSRLAEPKVDVQFDVVASTKRRDDLRYLSSVPPARGDVVAQAEAAYRSITDGLDDFRIIQTVEYVTPSALQRYRETAHARRAFLSRPYPVATGVVCKALRRAGQQIEIVALAAR